MTTHVHRLDKMGPDEAVSNIRRGKCEASDVATLRFGPRSPLTLCIL